MTEAEWVACTDPKPMLRFLLGTNHPRVQDVEAFPACRGSDRKLRLFACACYLCISHLLPDASARAVIEVAERFADGVATAEELQQAEAHVRVPLEDLEGRWRASEGAEREALLPTHEALALAFQAVLASAPKAAYYASSNAYLAVASIANPGSGGSGSGFSASRVAEQKAQTDLLRDIFGPALFRPVTVPPHVLAWNDRLVVRLSQSIYEQRRWGDMPILGDALLDAGCDDDEVLAHCRAGMGHVRGCWVVDVCLGWSWEQALTDEHPPFGHYPPRPDAIRVVLSGGPLNGFEVGVEPPLPPVIRVNAPRHGNHRVWITCTYALRGQQYEHIRTDNVNVATIC